jgi:hypothetical protein
VIEFYPNSAYAKQALGEAWRISIGVRAAGSLKSSIS